jgi:metallophosphoesterase superfamily enzyme
MIWLIPFFALLSCLPTAEHPAVRVRGRASYRVLKPTFAECCPHVLSSYTNEPLLPCMNPFLLFFYFFQKKSVVRALEMRVKDLEKQH